MKITDKDIRYIIKESVKKLIREYDSYDSNPLNKIFISFGTDKFDKNFFAPIKNIEHNNKPDGGIWAAELYDEGGSEWSDFVKSEMPKWKHGLDHHIIFQLTPDAKIYVIDGEEDALKFRCEGPYGAQFDYEQLYEMGYDGVFLSDRGNAILHDWYGYMGKPNFNSWDIASICVFNPNVIEIIPENIFDYDYNMGDDGNFDDEAEEYYFADNNGWDPDKRDRIVGQQMNRMYRQYGNRNVESDMSQFFNGKQPGMLAQGNGRDAHEAQRFKGTVK